MQLLRRRLVRQLGPLAFDHGSHLIGNDFDVLDLHHVLVEAFQVRRHHDLVGDQAGLLDAQSFVRCRLPS